ncbi:MAG: hypothetical protein MI743_20530 [Sneathiellales bacterium]|nr:hypothetical protein [Sneathiellales bacterium]
MVAGLLRKAGVLAILVMVSACITTPEKPRYAEITFQHLAPLRLDVGEIRIVNEYRAPLKSPNVEHELPVKIDQSVRRWVQDRLQAVGGSDAYAVVTIKDASAVEKPLPKTSGVKGLFTKDQSELYEFNVHAEIQVIEINGNKGLAIARSQRSRSISEEATLNERDALYFDLTESLMQDFDQEMEKNIRSFLGQFIR